MRQFTIVNAVFGMPFVLVSIVFLGTIACSNSFRSPIYKLYQVNIVLDLLCYCNVWVDKLVFDANFDSFLASVYKFSPGVFVVHNFLGHMFYHVQTGSCVLLCLYRGTIIWKPATKIWLKIYPFACLLLIVLSAIFTIPFAYINGLNSLSLDETTGALIRRTDSWDKFKWIMLGWTAFYFFTFLALYYWTSKVIGKLCQDKLCPYMAAIEIFIKVVLICDVLTGFALMLWEFFVSLQLVDLSNRTKFLFCISDFMSLSRPIIIIIVDKNIRKTMMPISCVVAVVANQVAPEVVAVAIANVPSDSSSQSEQNCC